ncbi:histone-lysine N-methyltransferase, H3 lysine-9 specific SUVH6 [Trifolium repens]|nr:histone-lysine N-methyltransferase, H3 lysine-9 specific SUVH6 [Trifolium repens]
MSLFNGHSEQELGIPLMENGGSSILARPMVKRCAVSAFRDFPEACGPFGSANGTSVEDKSEEYLGGEAVTPNLEDDSQHSEVDKNLFDTESLEQISDWSLKKEDLDVLSDQVDGDTLANDEAAKVALVGMENRDMEFATEVKKEDQVSSHQRVAAIRDFPRLCGRNARMKVDFHAWLDRSKTSVKTKHVPNHSEHVQLKKKSNSDDMAELVRWEKNSLDLNKKSNNFQSVPKSHGVNVPPLGRDNDPMARNKVRNALRACPSCFEKAFAGSKSKVKRERKKV